MPGYKRKHYRWVALLMIVVFIGLLVSPLVTEAQDTSSSQGTPVEITGVVSQITGNTIIVAGLTIDDSQIVLDANVAVGSTVQVIGTAVNNVIIAQTVVIVSLASATPEATLEPEMTPPPESTETVTSIGDNNVIIVVEGPVINIVNNVLTIYNFNVQVTPENPILSVISIGDIVRAEGALGGNGVIVATTVSNISSTTVVSGGTATVGLDGPVESIDGDQIVVNGVPVRLKPDDPLLKKVHTGDFVRVQGNFEGSGATTVLVVVNITIVNNIIVNGNPVCWFQEDGMGMGMGHWHCDGMGMGNNGMGMGMGDDNEND